MQAMPLTDRVTPASSEWEQLCTPSGLLRQFTSLVSVPVQAKSSSKMAPVPWPKYALDRAIASMETNSLNLNENI